MNLHCINKVIPERIINSPLNMFSWPNFHIFVCKLRELEDLDLEDAASQTRYTESSTKCGIG